MLEIRIGSYRAEAYSPESARYTSRLILVHGLWAGAWCWRHFGSFLAHRGWEAIAPDLRGRPGSRTAHVQDVKFEDYVSDLVEMIARETDSPPIVIGHDLGGLVAIAASLHVTCRAVVALAPPFSSAHTAAYVEMLRRSLGWLRRGVAHPPDALDEADLDPARLQADSGHLVRSLLRNEPILEKAGAPSLILAGKRDPYLDASRLEAHAQRLGAAFATRDAGHWGLQNRNFESHVDLVHRWLVRELGSSLLKLTGYEDLEEEPGDEK